MILPNTKMRALMSDIYFFAWWVINKYVLNKPPKVITLSLIINFIVSKITNNPKFTKSQIGLDWYVDIYYYFVVVWNKTLFHVTSNFIKHWLIMPMLCMLCCMFALSVVNHGMTCGSIFQ